MINKTILKTSITIIYLLSNSVAKTYCIDEMIKQPYIKQNINATAYDDPDQQWIPMAPSKKQPPTINNIVLSNMAIEGKQFIKVRAKATTYPYYAKDPNAYNGTTYHEYKNAFTEIYSPPSNEQTLIMINYYFDGEEHKKARQIEMIYNNQDDVFTGYISLDNNYPAMYYQENGEYPETTVFLTAMDAYGNITTEMPDNTWSPSLNVCLYGVDENTDTDGISELEEEVVCNLNYTINKRREHIEGTSYVDIKGMSGLYSNGKFELILKFYDEEGLPYGSVNSKHGSVAYYIYPTNYKYSNVTDTKQLIDGGMMILTLKTSDSVEMWRGDYMYMCQYPYGLGDINAFGLTYTYQHQGSIDDLWATCLPWLMPERMYYSKYMKTLEQYYMRREGDGIVAINIPRTFTANHFDTSSLESHTIWSHNEPPSVTIFAMTEHNNYELHDTTPALTLIRRVHKYTPIPEVLPPPAVGVSCGLKKSTNTKDSICAQAYVGAYDYCHITWEPSPSSFIESYEIYRSEDSSIDGKETLLGKVLSRTRAYTDMNIDRDGKRRKYRIKAVNTSQARSNYSEQVTCTVSVGSVANEYAPYEEGIECEQ